MTNMMVLSLKDTITHNVAQQLLSGQPRDYMYEYLGQVAEYLLSEIGIAAGITVDDVHDIYLYAWRNGPTEADVIAQWKERYGIELQVQGHGGSQIHPATLLEPILR